MNFCYDKYDSMGYDELEVELSKLSQGDRVDILSNILCQEFYLVDHVEHIKQILLILLRLESFDEANPTTTCREAPAIHGQENKR